MMRLYEQGSSHRLKAVGFRPNYVGGIFYEKTADSLTAGREALYVYRPLNGQRFTYASAGQSARAASSAMTMTSRWSCRIDAGT